MQLEQFSASRHMAPVKLTSLFKLATLIRPSFAPRINQTGYMSAAPTPWPRLVTITSSQDIPWTNMPRPSVTICTHRVRQNLSKTFATSRLRQSLRRAHGTVGKLVMSVVSGGCRHVLLARPVRRATLADSQLRHDLDKRAFFSPCT